MRSTPRRRFRCNNIAPKRRCPSSRPWPGNSSLQSSDWRQRHRRVSDDALAHQRQADIRGATKERGRLVDAIADFGGSYSWQKVRDLRRSGSLPWLDVFLMELGAEPRMSRDQRRQSVAGRPSSCSRVLRLARTAMPMRGKDLWHMRSLLFTDQWIPDRQHLWQISRPRHRHAADPHRLPDLRSSPLSPLSRVGLSGRTECSRLDPGQDLQRNRRQHQCRGEVRLQLRHHSLMQPSIAGSDFDPAMNSRLVKCPVDRCADATNALCGKRWLLWRLR